MAILESRTFPVGWTMDKIWKEMEECGSAGKSWESVGGDGNTWNVMEILGIFRKCVEVCGSMWNT